VCTVVKQYHIANLGNVIVHIVAKCNNFIAQHSIGYPTEYSYTQVKRYILVNFNGSIVYIITKYELYVIGDYL